MHISLFAFGLTVLCLPVANANYDVYRVVLKQPYAQGGTQIVWQTFSTPPDCPTALGPNDAVYGFQDSQDVSKKTGFRCVGSGCAQQTPASDIDVLEMHIQDNPLLHWTIYKDRGYQMYGLDGNVYGNCIVFPDADYDCGFDGSSSISGRRKFRCLTNRLGPTKRDLNGTAPISGQILATLP